MRKNGKQPALVPFRCPQCGKLVVRTLSGAKVFCPTCRRWMTAEEAYAGKAAAGRE